MKLLWTCAVLFTFALVSSATSGYPGGTPGFQTDAAPYCASCHASVTEESRGVSMKLASQDAWIWDYNEGAEAKGRKGPTPVTMTTPDPKKPTPVGPLGVPETTPKPKAPKGL